MDNVFYRDARFDSASEVAALLGAAGFGELVWLQTLSAAPFSPSAGSDFDRR